MAGHLNCDLYLINLAAGDVNDGKLHRLFLTLPKKCIVVIEDIDSSGIGREQEVIPPKATSQQILVDGTLGMLAGMPVNNGMHSREKRHAKITLSGLLNAIDGNASQEGRLLIMTSNNPNVLDEALIRPGRIDKQVYFGNLSPSAAVGIFERLVGRAAITTGNFTHEQIRVMATDFARKLPTNAFTPAQVQSFLQSCRGDPRKAIQEVEVWARKTVVETAGDSDSQVNGTRRKDEENQLGLGDRLGSVIPVATLSGDALSGSRPSATTTTLALSEVTLN